MKKYKIGRSISACKLEELGFKLDSSKKIIKKYFLRKQLTSDSYLEVIIKQFGNRFFYSNKTGSILYVGNDYKYGCYPKAIEGRTLGFIPVKKSYINSMGELIDEGILTLKYKPGKKK